MLAIRRATQEDARHVGEHLRKEDAAEVLFFGIDGVSAITASIDASIVADCLLVDGAPAAVFGMSLDQLVGGTGCPWMLTSPLVERYPIAFARETRRLLDRAFDLAPRLENIVDARYSRSIKWLKWLGFSVEPEYSGLRRFWMEKR